MLYHANACLCLYDWGVFNMIDTTIEIRSVDKQWLILALHRTIAQLEKYDDLKGCSGAHNYDLYYNIKKVKA